MSWVPRGTPAPGRLLIAGALVGLAGCGVLLGGVSPGGAVAEVRRIVDFLRDAGIAGPALFGGLQVLVALSGALPASLLGVAAGAIYGLVPGFALAAAGSLLGAIIAFGLSRSLCRSAIESVVARHPRLRSLDVSVAQSGLKLVCLLRLSPVMPFSATSFFLGLSSVSFADYLIGTLACLPALLAYVFVGTLGDAGFAAWAGAQNPLRWGLFAAGCIATLILAMHLIRLVLRRQLAQQPMGAEGGGGGGK